MYKHYLKFISLGQDFLYEITEPVGFDVANFVVEQNANRYARDISYGNEKADLNFYDIFGTEQRPTEQVINVQGQTSYILDMGLSWILESHNRFGFESKIEYHLFKDNVFFTTEARRTLRISDLGLRISFNPKSAIANPQFLLGDLRVSVVI